MSESQAIPSVFTAEIRGIGQILQATFAGNACQNVPTKIHYQILFNASLGISEATVNFEYENLTGTYYRMQFSVDFGWISDNQVLYRSGNPGYKDFEPVMAGQSIQVDEKQAVRLASDRFEWLTIPEATGQGLCTSTRPRAVLFRENLLAGCHFEMTTATGLNECIQLQKQINALLLGPDRNLIAAYANASVENPGDWVPLLIENQLQNTTTSPAAGTCANMIVGANFEFLFAYTGSIHNPQAKIIGAQKSYLPPTDVRFQCIGPYCQAGFETLTQKIPVVLTVSFVDVSSTAQPINARIPTFDARLPYDFFYPFTVGDSAASLSFWKYYLHFAIVILVFHQ